MQTTITTAPLVDVSNELATIAPAELKKLVSGYKQFCGDAIERAIFSTKSLFSLYKTLVELNRNGSPDRYFQLCATFDEDMKPVLTIAEINAGTTLEYFRYYRNNGKILCSKPGFADSETISPDSLKSMEESHQKQYRDDPNATRRALFSFRNFSLLYELARKADLDFICLTLIRFRYSPGETSIYAQQNIDGHSFSQVIPVLTPCIVDLSSANDILFFRYCRDKNKNIPYILPGDTRCEGSGLIPPPPPDDDDFGGNP